MDAQTLHANYEAREKAHAELRALVDEFAGKEMTAEARETETRLLDAIADYDGRVKRGVEAIRASESVSALMAGLRGTGSKKRTQDKLAEAASKLRSLGLNEGLTFAPETRVLDTATGSNVIPRTLFGQLLAEAVERSTVMRSGASILTTSGGESIDFTVVTGRASAGIVAENANIPESTPATVQRSVGAFKYAYASVVSTEFVQDQALDLVGFLVGDAGPALGHGMGEHFLIGTGNGQPTGILTSAPDADATWTEGAKDNTVSDALIDLFYELPSSYRGNAVFIVSDRTAAAMRKLKDGNGQYLWQSALTAGAPDTFNGKPVATDVAVPDDKVLFGDLSKYKVRLAGPLRVERSVDARFTSDQIVYRFIQRADGLLVDERAAKVLTVTP
ncbi:phage major capsid protein [Streptomyces alkaliterrae]|uniref:Phage major capsid protein n=1 Tax=Streptomyces alkaliterrae TaxID=2213162 RepID=A0A5P0YJ24_9ACTN|nr:phage major capsid protein [Streptomyces alkaliterrae]MBB1251838.1 phage major capsid protein [Streptomyces alkaliterrae]MBB1259297.1 phage major capsid protein [Streptomyces alkaliterrae]MQS00325.1 phage major capsid protein [Streptomyces alkaliterrae]